MTSGPGVASTQDRILHAQVDMTYQDQAGGTCAPAADPLPQHYLINVWKSTTMAAVRVYVCAPQAYMQYQVMDAGAVVHQ